MTYSIEPIIPKDYQTCMQIAETIAKSGLAPATLNTKEKVFVAIQMGAGLKLNPMQSISSIAVINGKPALYGDTMLAIVKSSGLLEFFNESVEEVDGELRATCHLKRKGINEISVTFTSTDAKKAGLWERSSPWRQYPKRMLQMRARSFALRDAFPDLLLGLQHSVEELTDSELEITNVTAPQKTVVENNSDELIKTIEFCEKDNKVELKIEDAFHYLYEKIDSINDLDQLEEYNEWSNSNKVAKRQFASYDRKLATILSERLDEVVHNLNEKEVLEESNTP